MLAVWVLVCAVAAGAGAAPRGGWASELVGLKCALDSAKMGFPSELSKGNELYLFIDAEAAYTRVSALSIGIASGDLTAALRSAMGCAGLPVDVVASGDAGFFHAAEVTVDRSSSRAGDTLRVGKLLESFRSRGQVSYTLLQVPKYFDSSRIGVREYRRPQHKWFNVTNAPEDMAITVAAPLSLGALAAYLQFVLPGLGVSGFLLGIVLGFSRRIPVGKRIAWFDWLAIGAPKLAGVAALATLFMVRASVFDRLVLSAWRPRVWDPSLAAVVFSVMIIALGLVAWPIRSRIFRGLADEPHLAELPVLERRARLVIQTVTLCSSAILAYFVAGRSFEMSFYSPSYGADPAFVVVSVFVVPLVMLLTAGVGRADAELSGRAKELAELLEVKVREVRVVGGLEGLLRPNGFVALSRKTIVVTREAADLLTPQQMDYLLLHELAHLRDVAVYRRACAHWQTPLRAALVLWVLRMQAGLCVVSPAAIWLAAALPVGVLVESMALGGIRARLEHEADIQAVLAGGDPDSAISALRALAAASGNCTSEDDAADEHPKLIKRIKAIRQIAAEVGIRCVEPKAEAPL